MNDLNDFYSINSGSVKKYTTKEKIHVKKIQYYHYIYVLLIVFALATTFAVFKLCISDNKNLSETIALGSIFATFGSSIVAVFSLVMSSCYDHFLSNIYVLFRQLEPGKEWQRWAFIKRRSHKILFNGENAYQELENATIVFDVGSHNIEVNIPTIKEDFFDLPNWHHWKLMRDKARDFESNVLTKNDNPAQALMVWDCIYNNYCSIIKYKIAKAFVVIGEAYILSSILWAFCYRIF